MATTSDFFYFFFGKLHNTFTGIQVFGAALISFRKRAFTVRKQWTATTVIFKFEAGYQHYVSGPKTLWNFKNSGNPRQPKKKQKKKLTDSNTPVQSIRPGLGAETIWTVIPLTPPALFSYFALWLYACFWASGSLLHLGPASTGISLIRTFRPWSRNSCCISSI